MTDKNWQALAACRGVDPELFFPEATDELRDGALDEPLVRRQVEAAKAVCRRCPVRERCLAEALERMPHGIAGGMTEQERRRARAQHEHPGGRSGDHAGARKPRWLVLLEAGCSQPEVAAEYGVSPRTIARWAARNPTAQTTQLEHSPTQTTDAAGGGPR
ncbi:hypothetical protein Acsp06_54220 [Actinomycetospora sp. NBRC 106375]|uniref:WhiB family transcriptional regulator n=1 Tax=Actinomycetospora sp. NBRC 106375 TaxID=3032207 RepID=UPI0024A40AF4|nr:hypothetical protein Acsp06_54220 [Actinomycetospora sp. NBRC 106375]